MRLVKCQLTDTEQVYNFYRKVVKHLDDTVNYPKWDDGHPSKDGVETAVRRGEQYICTDSDHIVGALMLSEDPEGYYEAGEWSCELDPGEYLTIHLFAVHPDMPRTGIGSFMLKECIRIARDRGYKAIRLDTVPDNHPANGLYLKHGFTYAGTKDLKRNIPNIPLFNLYELNL
ncbi:MAG: GNAT family N-acetyltransferase [Ruminococcus sp.]|nr:GNAT family N-acetyltransferase [Ruminococcus sp.]